MRDPFTEDTLVWLTVNETLEGVRVFLCLAFLIYASWSDLKKREVSNLVWAVFAPIAFAITSLQLFLFAQQQLHFYAISFGFTLALSIALFYTGAFGGADAKALICISLALPSYPTYLFQPLFGFISPLLPITVFCNAVLLAALSVIYVLIRNGLWKYRTGKPLFSGFEKESTGRKILTLLSGYKADANELKKKEHWYPLEDIQATETGESQRRLLLVPKEENRDEIVVRVLKAANEGKIQNGVWITPGLPMLIFITAGLIVALFVGDIVWIVYRSVLGYR